VLRAVRGKASAEPDAGISMRFSPGGGIQSSVGQSCEPGIFTGSLITPGSPESKIRGQDPWIGLNRKTEQSPRTSFFGSSGTIFVSASIGYQRSGVSNQRWRFAPYSHPGLQIQETSLVQFKNRPEGPRRADT